MNPAEAHTSVQKQPAWRRSHGTPACAGVCGCVCGVLGGLKRVEGVYVGGAGWGLDGRHGCDR